MRWEFFWKSGDFASMAVFRTDEDTRRPRRREWQQRNQYTEDWGFVRVGGRERKRKDNAEALSSLRFAEEEGLTTEDTESTGKQEVKNRKGGMLR
jgi:cytochrome c biogenesis protein ResB